MTSLLVSGCTNNRVQPSVGLNQPSISLNKITQIVRVYDGVVTFPFPGWYKNLSNFSNQSEFSRHQEGPVFILEQIPKGETFTNWSSLFAVYSLNVGTPTTTLDEFVMQSFGPFFSMCGTDNVAFEKLEDTNSDQTILLMCENSPNIEMPGYGDGIGEVAIFRFIKHKNSMIKVYQEWRGKRFDRADKSTWPVKMDELDMMIERFKSIRVTGP